ADDRGDVLVELASPLPAPVRDGERSEQPSQYSESAAALLTKACADLGDRAAAVRAVCVTGTSGTIVPCDARGVPTGNAVLYDDRRAHVEADLLRTSSPAPPATAALIAAPTSTLARLGWLAAHASAALYLHTSDVVATMLLGRVAATDTSHALKAGVDPVLAEWDTELLDAVGVPRRSLPDLVHPGTALGTIDTGVARDLGLPADVTVIAGMTDGCTGQLAAGAVADGDTVGVLGTTLVVKAVSTTPVIGFDGAVYSHYAPDGRFWAGGASNVGAGVLNTEYGDVGLSELDRAAERSRPHAVRYPLPGQGERFPFTDADVRGFTAGEVPDRASAFRVLLEGVAFTERLGLETLNRLGIRSDTHRVAGGASASPVWNRIRASVLNRTLLRPQRPSSAFGAAVLASAGATGEPLADVTARMVGVAERIEPDPEQTERLDERYRTLLDELRDRGLLQAQASGETTTGGELPC
ncbi:MAG: FGGY-family carbohydrate kinase, partial [Nocardioidaceae bacterium]